MHMDNAGMNVKQGEGGEGINELSSQKADKLPPVKGRVPLPEASRASVHALSFCS